MSTESLELREVPGPSALGGGTRRALELLYVIAVTDFKRTYFGTVLGYVWSVARPLLTFAVLLEVFTHVFHFASKVQHYPVFLLFDVVLFGFFQEATLGAVGSIVAHESIVRKTQFPRLVIPMAVVLTTLFNFALNLVVAFIFVLAFGITPAASWLLMIPVLLAIFVFTSAGVDAPVGAVSEIQGRGDHLDRALDRAVLRHAGAVSHLRPKSAPPRRDRAEPAGSAVRPWPSGPSPIRRHRGRGRPPPVARGGWPWPIGLYVVVCVLAVVIFRREAPRIAEEL